jgi:hypothetical protein
MRNVTDLLKTITPANGYVSDLSDIAGTPPIPRVYRGRGMFGDTDPLPMVSILQPPAPADPSDSPLGSPIEEQHLMLMLQGFVADDPFNPTDPAEVLMADVRKCLAAERARADSGRRTDLFGLGTQAPSFGGTGSTVLDFTVGTGLVRPSDHISVHAYFWLLLVVKIAENISLPYGK